uniref:WAPL domain-containing protein n=1 Tax=Panagrellus redivivus TaxID=6233 RepID=A0A7E4VZY2_PANRE
MTENEDCRRSGRDRRISSKLAAFFETENAFKKVRSPPSAERPAKAKNPTPAQAKPKNATPGVPKPKSSTEAVPKPKNTVPAVAKVQNPTPPAPKPKNATPAKPKAKKDQVSLLSVTAVKPQLSKLVVPVLPPTLPEPDLAEICEPATSSTSSIENVTPDNTPLSLSRPKREHRCSRRAIEAMESLSPTKKKQPVARVYESLQQPQQIQIDTVTQPSPSIVEYHDVLNENELIHADSPAAPKPKKRKISDSTRVSRNGVKIGRPSKEELQEYREFVIARGGDPDAPIPPKWRHEMLEAANKEAHIETPRFRRRKSPKRFSPVENAVQSPGIHVQEPAHSASTPAIRDPRANLKVALNLPTYTPPAVGESRSPVVLPSTARLSAPHRGAPAKFVNYGNKRRVAVPTQRTYVSPLVTNSTTVTTQPRTVVQARPPPVIRFLKPNSTPSSILRATKPKPPAPVAPEPNVAKPLTVDVTYPEPAPASTSEETHNFKGGYVTFPECADDRFTGIPRMYIPLEENIEYVLVNQNGELMCNEYTPPVTPEEAYPPQKIHAIFEVQPDCTLTVL